MCAILCKKCVRIFFAPTIASNLVYLYIVYKRKGTYCFKTVEKFTLKGVQEFMFVFCAVSVTTIIRDCFKIQKWALYARTHFSNNKLVHRWSLSQLKNFVIGYLLWYSFYCSKVCILVLISPFKVNTIFNNSTIEGLVATVFS